MAIYNHCIMFIPPQFNMNVYSRPVQAAVDGRWTGPIHADRSVLSRRERQAGQTTRIHSGGTSVVLV